MIPIEILKDFIKRKQKELGKLSEYENRSQASDIRFEITDAKRAIRILSHFYDLEEILEGDEEDDEEEEE